ncbi:GAF domain-containing protein [Neisseria montereyensis]|uniref:GAF domain-containing protein n=1 Tax=Neisseria montereyensis TaxID=2973938 RepID=A0ABT2FB67_9NEIS|nr:GAF domain-containing protein [Neisseria montereyensis]MCS4532758.1 GAF domain-containing protein [Neisseria montereyensis]
MHSLHINSTDKNEIYQELLPQIESLIQEEPDLIANLANIAAVLKTTFNWFWVGFYLADTQTKQLVLGPFQGPLACTRIPYGRGVCGQAWQKGETLVIEDVNRHPDHIACSSLSQSEIVVPVWNKEQQLLAVLDVDSSELASFNDTDAHYLGKLAEIITRYLG